ncbi:hypothetical protein CKO44_22065 [Rubrivivax gelatinosus]|uniref:DUF2917 family protein n=1 Tax=Rubrivivax gelatinosus TaxID=28068 RepID=A0ABS1E0Q4_RUBGE|nr:hypothetical protein [Rubrivivax gelatinosus]MBK1616145.1 hypothetical protein [Rubrivivax gelatinosus]MBK1715465.1 hypothetical protein [Rubrivivax gelatinosus]
MTTETLELAAGQALALQLRRGDELVLLRGTLELRAPALWLAGTLHQAVQPWHEGQALRAAETGVWQGRALSAATLLLQRREPAWRRWLAGPGRHRERSAWA